MEGHYELFMCVGCVKTMLLEEEPNFCPYCCKEMGLDDDLSTKTL